MTDETGIKKKKDLLRNKCDEVLGSMRSRAPLTYKGFPSYATFQPPPYDIDETTGESATYDSRHWTPLPNSAKLDRQALMAKHHFVAEPEWLPPIQTVQHRVPRPRSRGVKLRSVEAIVNDTQRQKALSNEERAGYMTARTPPRQQPPAQRPPPPPPPKSKMLDFLNEITSVSRTSSSNSNPSTTKSSTTTHTPTSSLSTTHNGNNNISKKSHQPSTPNKKPMDHSHPFKKPATTTATPPPPTSTITPTTTTTATSNTPRSAPRQVPSEKISTTKTNDVVSKSKPQSSDTNLDLFITKQFLINDMGDPAATRHLEDLSRSNVIEKRPILRISIMLNKKKSQTNESKTKEVIKKSKNDTQSSAVVSGDTSSAFNLPTGTIPTEFIRSMKIRKKSKSDQATATAAAKTSIPPPPSSSHKTSSLSKSQQHHHYMMELEEGETISPSPSPRRRPLSISPDRNKTSSSSNNSKRQRDEALMDDHELQKQQSRRNKTSKKEISAVPLSSSSSSSSTSSSSRHGTYDNMMEDRHHDTSTTGSKSGTTRSSRDRDDDRKSTSASSSKRLERSISGGGGDEYSDSSSNKKRSRRSSSGSRRSREEDSSSSRYHRSSQRSSRPRRSSRSRSRSPRRRSSSSSSNTRSSSLEKSRRHTPTTTTTTATATSSSSSSRNIHNNKSSSLKSSTTSSSSILNGPGTPKESGRTKDNIFGTPKDSASTPTNTTTTTTSVPSPAVLTSTKNSNTTSAAIAAIKNSASKAALENEKQHPPATAENAETPDQYRIFSMMFQKLALAYKRRGDHADTEIAGLLDHMHAFLNYVLAFHFHDRLNNDQTQKNWDTLHPFTGVLLKRLGSTKNRSRQDGALYGICQRMNALVHFYTFRRRELMAKPKVDRMVENPTALDDTKRLEYGKTLKKTMTDFETAYQAMRESDKYMAFEVIQAKFPVTYQNVCVQGQVGAGIVVGGEAGVSVGPMFPLIPHARLHHAAIMAKCLLQEFVDKERIDYRTITNTEDYM